MICKQFKLSQPEKEKLIRIKSKTGIQNWNIICRWALCWSLNEQTIPGGVDPQSDSNVEMSWLTFTGEYHEIYNPCGCYTEKFRRIGELFLGRDASHSCDGVRHMDVHSGKKKSACI